MNISRKVEKIKGITLIALVITIIVMLIIAGVAISAITTNGVPFGKMKESAELYNNAAHEEQNTINNIINAINSDWGNGDVDYGEPEPKTNIANEPELTEGMIPIKYNVATKKWVICSNTDPEWYSYTENEKRWANVMLCDGKYDNSTAVGTEVEEEDLGSMFVWIPRYAYKITSGYHSTSGSIDVIFLNGTSYNYYGEDESIKVAKKGTDEGVITESGYTDYIVHPCFTNGSENNYKAGEWDKEIKGIWVAKFQAGIYTTENDINKKESTTGLYYPVFKGRKYAYNYVTQSQCYDLSMTLDDTENPYKLSTDANSHLMKSSEWGAVAYLSISKYGYSGGTASEETEKAKNDVSIISYSSAIAGNTVMTNVNGDEVTAITGYSGSSGKSAENIISSYTNTSQLTDVINNRSYVWNYTDADSDIGAGTKSSTTGNIYGIYDMSGCLADYTAAYITGGTLTNGASFANGIYSKYATGYPSDTCVSSKVYDLDHAYPGWNKAFGDALYETSAGCGGGKAWFGQNVEADDNGNESFLPRGGRWGATDDVGLCGVDDGSGGAGSGHGFHSVLVVE